MEKTKKIIISFTVLAFCAAAFCRPIAAGEKSFEDTAAGKASKELIKQFTTFVKDVTEMQGMTDEQKVNYILTKGKERIWKETSSRIKDTAKDKMLDYVKARMRADLFKGMVPQMVNQAVIEGKAVGTVWSAADIEIKSKLDTQMNAVKSGISAAKIGWSVYSTWKLKGAEEGCRELGQQVGEKIIEYFIPGWGWYTLSQEVVKAIGNYVVGYAFDTSLQAKMDVILGPNDPKRNPAGFKNWIMGLDIQSYVQREWDEQLAYGGWYLKGADEGENMKKAIIAQLSRMKADIAQKAQVENELHSNLERLDDEAKAASNSVNTIIDGASKEAQPALALIDNFASSIYNYKAQDEKEVIADTTKTYEDEEKRDALMKTAVKYTPFDHSGILSALEAALGEIQDSGTGGYNQKTYDNNYAYYLDTRKKVIGEKQAWIDEQINKGRAVIDTAEKTYRPQMNAIEVRKGQLAWNDPQQGALQAQYDALGNAYTAACSPYWNVADGVFASPFGGEQAALAAEEQEIILEAKGRALKMRMNLQALAEKLQGKMDQLTQAYKEGTTALNTKAATTLKIPDGWCSPDYYKNLADNLRVGYESQYEMQGDVEKQAAELEDKKSSLEADRNASTDLYNERLKLFNQYCTAYRNLINEYENAAPKLLQANTQKKDQEWFDYDYLANVNAFRSIADIDEYGTIPPMTILAVPRLAGSYYSNDTYAKELEPALVLDQLDAAIAAVKQKRQEIDPLFNADHLFTIYVRLQIMLTDDNFMLRVPDITLEQEKARQGDMFILPGDSAFMFILPENMKGYDYLTNLKRVWAQFKDSVEKMNNLKKGIGNIVNYRTKLQEAYFPILERWNSIPERIKIYEESLETVTKERDKRLALTEQYLKEGQAKVEDIDKNSPILQDKVTQLEKFKKDYINSNLSLYNGWSTHAKNDRLDKVIEGWKELDKKVAELVSTTNEAIETEKRKTQAQWAAQEAERARQEAERKKKEDEQRAQEERSSVRGQYVVLNPRLNSYSLDGMRGDLVLMQNDLKQGNIEITARLTTIDKVDRILISEDNGRTWKELPVQADILYSFSPIPDKTYLPVLRLHNTLSDEVEMQIFPTVNSIIYRDIDYQQMVMEAVKHLADAYEAKNISQFSDCISRDFLGNKTFLEEGARFDFDLFADIKLSIYINRIEKRGDLFVADTRWDKTQVPRKTGQEQKTSGNTTMMFVLEDGRMKIKNLRGNLIYATLSPEIAQASGLPSTVVDEIRVANQERNPIQPGAGTTEDPGGLTTGTSASNIQSGTFSLTQNDAHPAVNWIQEYDFSTNTVQTSAAVFGPTYDFRRREGFVEVKAGDGIQDIGAVNINSVTEAPAGGYTADSTPTAGHTYAIQLSDGTYALVSITSLGSFPFPTTATFQYRHQINGTRSFQ